MFWIGFLASGSALIAQGLDRPRFEPGREYVTRHTQHTEVVLNVDNGVRQVIELSLDLRSRVRDGRGKVDREVASSITRLTVAMEVGGVALKYDSADAASRSSVLAESFGKLVGREFTVQLDADGKVSTLR